MRRVCEQLDWVDLPLDDRRLHERAVPRLGGVAIYLSVCVAFLCLPFLDNLVTDSLREQSSQLYAVAISATIVFLFGIYDDLAGANALWKFLVQGAAGALLYALGGRIEMLNIPFLDPIALSPALSFAITVFWVVGISNAFNLIDGMDGLATGAALFASIVMMVVSIMSGRTFVTVITVALAAALIGFLRYNFNPASIFLGDSGSLFIGFLLAALSIQGMQKASTVVAVAIPVLAFGLPILDTSVSIVRRFIAGRPIFQGDREHVHHMLLARGWSQKQVVFVLYGVCAAFGLVALLFTQDMGRTTGFILLIVGAAIIVTLGQLRYHEVDELKASVQRNVTDRRRRTKNNVRVRRASSAVAEATNLKEILDAVRAMLDESDFDCAKMQICYRQQEGTTPASSYNFADFFNQVELPNDTDNLIVGSSKVDWTWKRTDDVSVDDENQSSTATQQHWTLRVPLTTARGDWGYINFYHGINSKIVLLDINCLCNVFQPALAETIERLMTKIEKTSDSRAEDSVPLLKLSASNSRTK